MTDYSNVQNMLKSIADCDDSELERYDLFIKNAVAGVDEILKADSDDNDSRVVYLCAAKAYYQALTAWSASDDIVSFKAGDVSYERDGSRIEAAKNIYRLALEDCFTLVESDGFVFRAV